jgi:trypsin
MRTRGILIALSAWLVVFFGCVRVTWPPEGAIGGNPPAVLEDGGSDAPALVPCRARVTRAPNPRARPAARVAPRIVGGHPSVPGMWPAAAALELPDGWQFCGGTLVGPRWVLTAAHCDTRPGELAVIGRVDLRTEDGESIAIDEVRTHEAFSSPTKGNDVALLHLSRASAVLPARMVATGWAGSSLAVAVGYGLEAEYASSTSPVLREVEVNIWAQPICVSSYLTLPVTAICAGGSGLDTCQGDSGGGLFLKLSGLVAGLTSYGDGCGGKPGVYTSVAAVRDWVDACMVEP